MGYIKSIWEAAATMRDIREIIISYPISKNTWILDVHGIGGNC